MCFCWLLDCFDSDNYAECMWFTVVAFVDFVIWAVDIVIVILTPWAVVIVIVSVLASSRRLHSSQWCSWCHRQWCSRSNSQMMNRLQRTRRMSQGRLQLALQLRSRMFLHLGMMQSAAAALLSRLLVGQGWVSWLKLWTVIWMLVWPPLCPTMGCWLCCMSSPAPSRSVRYQSWEPWCKYYLWSVQSVEFHAQVPQLFYIWSVCFGMSERETVSRQSYCK